MPDNIYLGLNAKSINDGLLDHYFVKFLQIFQGVMERRFRNEDSDSIYTVTAETIHLHILGLDEPNMTRVLNNILNDIYCGA